jgi:hypothetical protein
MVTSARLTFDESEGWWTDSGGNSRTVRVCVSTIGVPTVDWVANPFPHTTFADVSPWPSDREDFNSREFDVTDPVQMALLPTPQPAPGAGPISEAERKVAASAQCTFAYGLILRGAIEELHDDDQASCMSSLSNIQLHVTHMVPTAEPRRRRPGGCLR